VEASYSAPVQTGPGVHLASCTMGTVYFPGVNSDRCRGQERVELYLYSPYEPYVLYRASVPVQGCTLSFTYSIKSVSQTPGRGPVPGPGINYTGPREILLELITNLNVILYLST